MAQTPNQNKNQAQKDTNALNEKPSNLVTLELSEGKKAQCVRAKGKHVIEAQRLMGGNAENMIPALISTCTAIDGKKLTMEEVLDMDASDFLILMTHFSAAFPSSQDT